MHNNKIANNKWQGNHRRIKLKIEKNSQYNNLYKCIIVNYLNTMVVKKWQKSHPSIKIKIEKNKIEILGQIHKMVKQICKGENRRGRIFNIKF